MNKKNNFEVEKCFRMENYSGNIEWIPAEDGGIYQGGRKQECDLLDSCEGGLSQSGGGCYKWAVSFDAPAIGWGFQQ